MDSAIPSVLHVNDCASTAAHLIAAAARRGAHWDLLPLATRPGSTGGARGVPLKAWAGLRWTAELRTQARRHDVVHVHSAGILRHARFGVSRFVLHCHGTDVRTQQYQAKWAASVRRGLTEAEAVFYSTPDLAEHVLPHRADATYLPVPIDVRELPRWAPPAGRPRVVFASRWGMDKGGETQVEAARDLVAALGPDVDVLGLDWGPMSTSAAEAGVRLVGPFDRVDYLELLASASVVVGQSAGILAASELEALGIGAPLAVPSELTLYAGDPPPVVRCSAHELAPAVVALVRGETPHDTSTGTEYVSRVHGADRALDQVLLTYEDVLTAR